jgi:hypothetical protein
MIKGTRDRTPHLHTINKIDRNCLSVASRSGANCFISINARNVNSASNSERGRGGRGRRMGVTVMEYGKLCICQLLVRLAFWQYLLAAGWLAGSCQPSESVNVRNGIRNRAVVKRYGNMCVCNITCMWGCERPKRWKILS